MRMSDAFPSKYLKAGDLGGNSVPVTIARVDVEEVGRDRESRLVIYFKGADKGLVCNKTNGKKIAKAYGEETNDWVGKPIILYPTEVDFQGESVEAIRVKIAPSGGEVVTRSAMDLDDEIPF